MQFLTILAALTSAAFAADVCRPTGTDCFGNAACCTGIQENNCCNLGGSSTRIRFKLPNNRSVFSPVPSFPLLRVSRTNLRHYSRAQGFSNSGCSAGGVTTPNPNARTVCLTYSGNRQSGRWLTGLASRVKREPEVEACAEPNVVLKVRDGVTRRIELSDGMTIEEALETEGGEIVDAMGIQGEYELAE
jgi:hypothetical protein